MQNVTQQPSTSFRKRFSRISARFSDWAEQFVERNRTHDYRTEAIDRLTAAIERQTSFNGYLPFAQEARRTSVVGEDLQPLVTGASNRESSILKSQIEALESENRQLRVENAWLQMFGVSWPYPPDNWTDFEDFTDLSPN